MTCRRASTLAAAAGCVTALALGSGVAPASALAPWWHLTSGARPGHLAVGVGEVVVTASNLGDAVMNGETTPVVIRDRLPHGITVKGVSASAGFTHGLPNPVCEIQSESQVLCTFAHVLPPYEQIEVVVNVEVAPGALSTNLVTVTGGGAPDSSLRRPLTLSEEPTPFGIEDYKSSLEEEGGTPDTQAGSHAFQWTTTITLEQNGEEGPVALPKDVNLNLPPGLIGNPSTFPQCNLSAFAARRNECSPQSVMGVANVTFVEPGHIGLQTATVPVYNLEPNEGEPARLGFRPTLQTPVFVDTSVRTGSDYGVTATVRNVTEQIAFLSSKVTLWGVPGSPTHDRARGEGCLIDARAEAVGGAPTEPCQPLGQNAPPPFVTLPTTCARNPSTGEPEALSTSVEVDAWRAPGDFQSFAGEGMQAVDGCDKLPFHPGITVLPNGTAGGSSTAGSSATGLITDVHLDQQSILDSASLAQSAVKDITVTLPEGLAINPAGAGGLQACSEGEVGFVGEERPSGTLLFTAAEPEPFCPEAAKVANVEIDSPLLPATQHLKGAVYIATQNSNPFGSLIAMYIVAEDPISGVLVKQSGEAHLTESGQIGATFKNLPQLPFEDAKIEFFGGERAPLASPSRCGAYTTAASFVPWAAEPSDEAAVTASASSTFDITTGPGGSPCPGPTLPFAPSLSAGSTNVNAGSFSPVTTTIGRADGQQSLQSVQLHLPGGLAGLISAIKPCPEAQANAGTCGPESLIGETTVSAGVGADPVIVTGGKVYITEPYAGAPFGLSIVSPVKAGPFDLEHDTSNPAQQPACDCIVVRAKIEVNPITAELTIATDQSGPHAIPREIDGVPVQIRKVNAIVNRPGFTFNPTNCNPLTVSGTIAGGEGGLAAPSSPFQVTDCSRLKFTPTVTITTQGRASKRNGTSLTFKIAYPKNAIGSQSWFHKARFEIPRQLPARLETIQQACLAAVFEHDRGACPVHSVIGHAVVHTPVLPVPLEGPVYFVSFGGAKFPDAVLVLQGDNVNVELRGETFINSKTGITSATFASTPDVPFESVEVTLPAGPFGEFGVNLPLRAHYDLCGTRLVMPTQLRAQNGLAINRNTPIKVVGCPAHKKAGATRSSRRKARRH